MKWRLLVPKDKIPNSPQELIDILLRNREIKTKEEKHCFIYSPSPGNISIAQTGIDPGQVKKAVSCIRKTIAKGRRILIYGDYDADGLCGTAILWETILQLGGVSTPFIPDRVKDGYGINKESLLRILKATPDISLVISVDNGIVAQEAVEFLKNKGIETIVVDHHLKGEVLPEASAIIHTAELSGSGVAWFLARQLLERGMPDLGLAALGTIADVLPLVGINRSLVKFGLPYLENTARVGLRYLYREAGIEGKRIDVHKVSFIIAPRLNALGRIANPIDGLALLCHRQPDRGERLAALANQVNIRRQRMTDDGLSLAEEILLKERLPKLIFVSSPFYHQGIIGLIAGKLSERYHRPSIVIQENGDICKGSARSIKGFNIISALRNFKDLFLELGGHAMAAGFIIKRENLPKLKRRLLSLADEFLSDDLLVPSIDIDCQLSINQLTMEYYRAINQLSPFGVGNPQPTFLLSQARVVGIERVGNSRQHLKLFLDDPRTPLIERVPVEVIGFGLGEWSEKILVGDLLDIVFNLDLDNWGGRQRIVLKLKDLKMAQKVIE